jgi:hypothetical protein
MHYSICNRLARVDSRQFLPSLSNMLGVSRIDDQALVTGREAGRNGNDLTM